MRNSKGKSLLKQLSGIIAFVLLASPAGAVTLTFDAAISGATSYSFDQDSDGIPDAIFSTTDPAGFNTVGPGPNMSYIDEPGLEGTTSLAPDLRVDFPNGAAGSLGFGFALSASSASPNLTVTFNVYDASSNLLASVTQLAAYTQPVPPTPSSFPEASVAASFAGTARYATFDFDDTDAARYILDNFTGTFGSVERGTINSVPTLSEWGLILMSLLLVLAATAEMWRKHRA